MHIAIRAAGFSLMTMFVSCGVGAKDMDTRATHVDISPKPEVFGAQWKTPLPKLATPHNR